MTNLDYHGKLMRWKPINHDEDSFLNRIAEQVTVCAILEPGDGTQYDLILSPGEPVNDVLHYDPTAVKQALIVVRVTGGDPCGLAIVAPHDYFHVYDLSNSNEWTVAFFTWWFATLYEKLNA